jgi:hypothetical protein
MNLIRQGEYKNLLEKLRDPQRRSWIMLNPTSIGDTAIACSLAAAFVRHHGHGITMVVPPDHAPITRMFPDRFLRVLTMDRPAMMYLLNNFVDPNRLELDLPFCAHSYDHGDCRNDQLMYLYKFPGRGGLSMTDMLRYLLRLPWDARLDRPELPAEWIAEAHALAASVGMERGRSVTLFPANSSPIAQFPDALWANVVQQLNERGYKVFCNMRGGNFRPQTMPIAGSIPIDVPVHLALPLVSFAGRTISGPNGMQFLQMLGGRFEHMTVLAPVGCNYNDYEMNLRLYPAHATLAQYMYPEMCLDVPFSEYTVSPNNSEEEFKRVASAIADESQDDPCYVRRPGMSGQRYTDENRSWLQALIEKVKTDEG